MNKTVSTSINPVLTFNDTNRNVNIGTTIEGVFIDRTPEGHIFYCFSTSDGKRIPINPRARMQMKDRFIGSIDKAIYELFRDYKGANPYQIASALFENFIGRKIIYTISDDRQFVKLEWAE